MTAPGIAAWTAGLAEELGFWDRWLATRGLQWPAEYAARLDPAAPMDARVAEAARAVARDGAVRILDVGAGPVTAIGYRADGLSVTVDATDPLAPAYAALLARHAVTPPVATRFALAEELHLFAAAAAYDLVHCRNALDHAFDPLRGIDQMLAATRIGGVVLLRHFADEAAREGYRGLHQWNFALRDGGTRFVIWNRAGETDVAAALRCPCRIACRADGGAVDVLIAKTGAAPPEPGDATRARLAALAEACVATLAGQAIAAPARPPPAAPAVRPAAPAAPPPVPDPGLVFDLGLHRGRDARFYLDKGFRVVGLEANPALSAAARQAFAAEIAAARLTLVDAALWHADGARIPFWVNPAVDDWSSVDRAWAEKDGTPAQAVEAATVTLPALFDRHGVPRYLKCDLEGMDEALAAQLLADARRPDFVSIEAVSLDALALLRAAGYDRVQIVNQALLPYVTPPDPPREGRFAAARFDGHMSGPFGQELDPARWTGFREAAEAWLDFHRLHARAPGLAVGWLDFHVTTAAALAAAR